MVFELSLRLFYHYYNTFNICSLPPKGANALWRLLCDFNIKLREIVNFLKAFVFYS
jgi:hypothetical protein